MERNDFGIKEAVTTRRMRYPKWSFWCFSASLPLLYLKQCIIGRTDVEEEQEWIDRWVLKILARLEFLLHIIQQVFLLKPTAMYCPYIWDPDYFLFLSLVKRKEWRTNDSGSYLIKIHATCSLLQLCAFDVPQFLTNFYRRSLLRQIFAFLCSWTFKKYCRKCSWIFEMCYVLRNAGCYWAPLQYCIWWIKDRANQSLLRDSSTRHKKNGHSTKISRRRLEYEFRRYFDSISKIITSSQIILVSTHRPQMDGRLSWPRQNPDQEPGMGLHATAGVPPTPPPRHLPIIHYV